MISQIEENRPSVSGNTAVTLSRRNPSSTSVNITSSKYGKIQELKEEKDPFGKRCIKFIYNREKKTFCERTCRSWLYIFIYAVIYFLFLSTFTLIFLYGTLMIMMSTVDYQSINKAELLTYSEKGIGLTASPISETSYPIIMYKHGDENDFRKYIDAIDRLFKSNRRKRNVEDLGPCGKPPYGYGETPCIIIRINKQWKWAGKPLQLNSTNIKDPPMQVKGWVRRDNKLWLYCNGYNSYDKEHIGIINYYPDPPGYDPKLFPLDMASTSPFIAVQILNFSLGLSLAVECKLWYEGGSSSIDFMIYVAPNSEK